MQRKIADKPLHTSLQRTSNQQAICYYVVVSYQHHTDQHIHKDIASHYQIDTCDIRVQRIVEESNMIRNNLRSLTHKSLLAYATSQYHHYTYRYLTQRHISALGILQAGSYWHHTDTLRVTAHKLPLYSNTATEYY